MGEVTTKLKMEKRKVRFLLLKATPESEAQAKFKQLNVQDEKKRDLLLVWLSSIGMTAWLSKDIIGL